MSIRERVVTGSFWAALGGWASQLLLLGVFIVLARFIGPAEFGLFALAGIFVGLGQVLVNPGLTQALVNIDEVPLSVTGTAFWTVVVLALLAVGLLCAGAFLFYPLYDDEGVRNLLLVMAPQLLPVAFALVPQALLARALRFGEIALANALANACGGIAALLAAYAEMGVWALVVQQYIAALVNMLVLYSRCCWKPVAVFSLPSLGALFKQGGHFLGINFIAFLNRRADNALVGYFFGVNALGLYVVAKRVFTLFSDLVIRPFSQVSLSAFARLERDKEAICNAYFRFVTMTSLLSVPAFVGFIAVSSEFMALFFGDKWVPSIGLLQVLCLAGLTRGITLFTSPVLTALNRGRLALGLNVANTLANFAAYLLFLPMGLIGIGVGFSARALVFLVVVVCIARSVIGVSVPQLLRQLAPVYGAAGMMGASVLALQAALERQPPASALVVVVFTGLFIYGALLVLLRRELVADFLKLLRIVMGR